MQVNVTFRHLEPSDALKAFAQEKVERVNKYLNDAAEASVVLSLEKHVHHAEVMVHSGPFFLRGKEKSGDMYASIGLAMDKIEKQLRRYKDRLRHHKTSPHHNGASKKVRQEIIEDHEIDHEGVSQAPAAPSRVVQTNELTAKRMTVDEAVLQLNLLDESFIVFTNDSTGHVAVLHRVRDSLSNGAGDGIPDRPVYSLIDARPS